MSPVLSPLPRRGRRAALDVDNMTYEELQLLCERNGNVKDKAAAAEVVARLPTASFEEKKSEQDDEANSCSICLMPFKKRQVIKTLPCFHKFHAKEIDKWLATNNSCPICKSAVDG